MGIFNFFSKKAPHKQQDPLDSDSVRYGLSYSDCLDIYLSTPYGKILAEALPRYVIPLGRKFVFDFFPSAVTADFINRLDFVEKKLKINKTIEEAVIQSRIFGKSYIFATEKPLSFNVLGPLPVGDAKTDQSVTSPNFYRDTHITLNGITYDSNRFYSVTHGLKFFGVRHSESISWNGTSIYKNLIKYITLLNQLVNSLDNASYKASVMVFKSNRGYNGQMNGLLANTLKHNATQIRQATSGEVLNIGNDENVEFFPTQNIGEIQKMIETTTKQLYLALGDTPLQLLNQDRMSGTFSEGGQDMQKFLAIINNFRNNVLIPIYDFLDNFLVEEAFSKKWLENYILTQGEKLPVNYRSVDTLKFAIKQNYRFEFRSPNPITEKERLENANLFLNSLNKIGIMGASKERMSEELNVAKIFTGEIQFTLENAVINNKIQQVAEHNNGFADRKE